MANSEPVHYLKGTQVTIQWLVQKLKTSVDPGNNRNARMENWNSKIISPGDGFMSHIIRVEIQWENGPSLPSVVILKIPTLDKVAKLMEYMTDSKINDPETAKKVFSTTLPGAHNKECTMYEMFKNSEFPMPTPKTYFTEKVSDHLHDGVICMEDLSTYGTLVNIGDGLRLEQVFSLADGIASLHAYSLKTHGNWQQLMPKPERDKIKELPNMVKAAGIQLEKMKPEYFLGKIQKIYHHIENLTQLYEDMCTGSPEVIVHADAWTANMIFEKTSDGGPGDKLLAMVDWQVVHPGNIGQDLSRILLTSCSPDLRRNHDEEILKFYYGKLLEKMGSEGVSFGFDQVKDVYMRMFPCTVAVFILQSPLLINSPILDGPNREERVENVLQRCKCILDDLISLDENKSNIHE